MSAEQARTAEGFNEVANGYLPPEELPAAAPAEPPNMPLPARKVFLYYICALLFALTQGLGMNLAFANLTQIQGSIAATTTEAAWLSAAYMAPNVSLAIGLVKIRMQYGLRNFAEVSIIGFLVASALNLFVSDLQSAIFVRFLSGIAAAPLSTLAFLYILEAMPPAKKMTIGVSLAMMNTTLAAPITRLVSPTLLDYGQWRGLYTLEMALALLVVPIIYLLPLTPPPRMKVIAPADVGVYLMIAVGFGCLAVVLSLGRLDWWLEAPWLGVVLAVSLVSLVTATLIEVNRKTPLIDVRWLLTWPNIHLTGVLLVFRLIVATQSYIIMSYYQSVAGLLYDQLTMLYWIILIFSFAGGLSCAALMNRGYRWQIHTVALIMMAVSAFMDSNLTVMTRPEQMYLSQALMAAATGLFLPPSMAAGLEAASAKGPHYLVTFFVIFLFTQSIGGLLGSAFFGTLIIVREKFHSNMLVQHVLLTDPVVADRVNQFAATYGKVIGDSAILKAEGLVLLGARITAQANALAYGDAFFVAGVIALLALAAQLFHLAIIALWSRRRDPVTIAASTP